MHVKDAAYAGETSERL
ncbi:hypothetical protein, partial [Glycomyces tenuis]